MKNLIIPNICILLCIVCGTHEEVEINPAADYTEQAQEFVSMLSQEDYAGCVATFDQIMLNSLPAPELEGAWNTVLTQMGVYQKQIGVRQAREGGYDVVYVTCQFAQGKMNIEVVYNTNREVTGLWFRPAE
jgi:hypothetical protein